MFTRTLKQTLIVVSTIKQPFEMSMDSKHEDVFNNVWRKLDSWEVAPDIFKSAVSLFSIGGPGGREKFSIFSDELNSTTTGL